MVLNVLFSAFPFIKCSTGLNVMMKIGYKIAVFKRFFLRGKQVKNLLAGIPEPLEEEWKETLLSMPGFRIERIVSRGHRSPDGFWYDQEENEWILLLQGSAGLRLEGQKEILVLRPGDSFHIDRRRKHRVEWTDPKKNTVWLAVYYAGSSYFK